jgi:tetratricopeptide (TPR) repeat protein
MPQESERLTKLRAMLEKSPGDPFLLYATAMEFKKSGDTPSAIEYFDKTIQHDWGYAYAYFQKGHAQETSGDVEAAKATYRAGIDAAQRKGDQHAAGEIAGALAMIE